MYQSINPALVAAYPFGPAVAEFISLLKSKRPSGTRWGDYGDVTWEDVKIHDTLGYTVLAGRYSVTVYSDRSGPTARLWVGPPLTDPKLLEIWLRQNFVNTAMRNEPRYTLRYGGSDKIEYYTRYGHVYGTKNGPFGDPHDDWRPDGLLPKYLIHDSDLGREHGLYKGDRQYYPCTEFLQLLADELQKRVEKLRAM